MNLWLVLKMMFGVQLLVIIATLFILRTSGLPTPKETQVPSEQREEQFQTPMLQTRFRRGFGYRTICVNKPKKFCTMIEYGGVLKQFCLTKNFLHCTALD